MMSKGTVKGNQRDAWRDQGNAPMGRGRGGFGQSRFPMEKATGKAPGGKQGSCLFLDGAGLPDDARLHPGGGDGHQAGHGPVIESGAHVPEEARV